MRGRVPAGFQPLPVIDVVPRSRDYIVMATRERGQWVFNPPDDHMLQPGAAIVLMTNPGARMRLERLLSGT